MPLTLNNQLQPGTYEDVSKVQANFVSLRDYLNGNLDGDAPALAARQQLALDSTASERRGMNNPVGAGGQTTVGQQAVLARVSGVNMPNGGILWVSAMVYMDVTTNPFLGNGTGYTWQIQLNGVVAKSRFGTAPPSGASLGVLSITDGSTPTDGSRRIVYTETADAAIATVYSANGGDDVEPPVHILGTPVPIAVNAGVYTVDLVNILNNYTPGIWDQSGDLIVGPRIYVKAEGY